MYVSVIQFDTLAVLANYLKAIKPEGYTVNTLRNALAANLSATELSLALKYYGAVLVQQNIV